MTITDEMVDKAFRIYWGTSSIDSPEMDLNAMRAALEAVAPMIEAQAIQRVIDQLYKDGHLSARAQELDPQ